MEETELQCLQRKMNKNINNDRFFFRTMQLEYPVKKFYLNKFWN